MTGLEQFRGSLDGELFTPETAGYDIVRRPENLAFADARPRIVVVCRSEQDVVRTISYAAATGMRLAPRGGGHCFAGRSSAGDIVLDLSPLNAITMLGDGAAVVGAGARLGAVYRALHAARRTLPAGCGSTVGIAGLTLGGGIGLLGRSSGLTCDRLRAARVVLADGRIVDCSREREPDLFWALRGAGGGQFGVVTSLCFDTVPEPMVVRLDAEWVGADPADLVAAWQAWAPGAPDGMTLTLTVEGESSGTVHALMAGASLLSEARTGELVTEFFSALRVTPPLLTSAVPYSTMKETLVDGTRSSAEHPVRIRSEFFSRPMSDQTIASVLALLSEPGASSTRRLSFTAMGGAYNRVAEDATAFAHRHELFLLEHVGASDDPWVDASWSSVHREASGRVYPNFPDRALGDALAAYHAGNAPRLSAVKRKYDPQSFFDFPQAIPPAPVQRSNRPDYDTKEVRP